MGLESCRECDEEVSTEADECPNCGVPHPTGESPDSCAKQLLDVIAILVGVVAMFWAVTSMLAGNVLGALLALAVLAGSFAVATN